MEGEKTINGYDLFPNIKPAGKVYDNKNCDSVFERMIAGEKLRNERPETPIHVARWRKSYSHKRPGAKCLPPSMRDLGEKMSQCALEKNQVFGRKSTSASNASVKELIHPEAKSSIAQHVQDRKESIYASSCKQPLGRSYVRGHALPPITQGEDFRFGFVGNVRSNLDSVAGSLGFSNNGSITETFAANPKDSIPKKIDLHYNWSQLGIDPKNFTFGKPKASLADRPSVSSILASNIVEKSTTRVGLGRREDFAASQLTRVGASKLNQSNAVRHILATQKDHRFGLPLKYDEWGVNELLKTNTTDHNLGDVPKPRSELRNMACAGAPSVRHDLRPPTLRSVANYINYGDEVGAEGLISPPSFSLDVCANELTIPRLFDDVRNLFTISEMEQSKSSNRLKIYKLSNSVDRRSKVVKSLMNGLNRFIQLNSLCNPQKDMDDNRIERRNNLKDENHVNYTSNRCRFNVKVPLKSTFHNVKLTKSMKKAVKNEFAVNYLEKLNLRPTPQLIQRIVHEKCGNHQFRIGFSSNYYYIQYGNEMSVTKSCNDDSKVVNSKSKMIQNQNNNHEMDRELKLIEMLKKRSKIVDSLIEQQTKIGKPTKKSQINRETEINEYRHKINGKNVKNRYANTESFLKTNEVTKLLLKYSQKYYKRFKMANANTKWIKEKRNEKSIEKSIEKFQLFCENRDLVHFLCDSADRQIFSIENWLKRARNGKNEIMINYAINEIKKPISIRIEEISSIQQLFIQHIPCEIPSSNHNYTNQQLIDIESLLMNSQISQFIALLVHFIYYTLFNDICNEALHIKQIMKIELEIASILSSIDNVFNVLPCSTLFHRPIFLDSIHFTVHIIFHNHFAKWYSLNELSDHENRMNPLDRSIECIIDRIIDFDYIHDQPIHESSLSSSPFQTSRILGRSKNMITNQCAPAREKGKLYSSILINLQRRHHRYRYYWRGAALFRHRVMSRHRLVSSSTPSSLSSSSQSSGLTPYVWPYWPSFVQPLDMQLWTQDCMDEKPLNFTLHSNQNPQINRQLHSDDIKSQTSQNDSSIVMEIKVNRKRRRYTVEKEFEWSEEDDVQFYEVEQVLDHALRGRGNNRRMHYLVSWKGYSSDHNSWEPVEHLTPDLIEAYEKYHSND